MRQLLIRRGNASPPRFWLSRSAVIDSQSASVGIRSPPGIAFPEVILLPTRAQGAGRRRVFIRPAPVHRDGLAALRDRALLAFGMGLAARRSELVALDVADLEWGEQGGALVGDEPHQPAVGGAGF